MVMNLQGFNTSIGRAIEEVVSTIQLHDGGICDWSWDNKYSRVLACLVKEGIVPKEKLSEFVHKQLVAVGQRCHLQHVNGQYPDHTHCPAAFAYALRHGAFTHKEEVSIKYDHGQTKDTFIQQYERGIFEKVMERLLTEKESTKFPEFGDHCC